jgi:hypothetical protein
VSASPIFLAMTMNTLDKAIRLAACGLPAFFCGRSKRPTLEGGFHNATTDAAALKLLYDKAPGALIGVPCGIKFVVIDPDLQHRPAREWWKANKDRLPVTRRHRTASGGWHILFKPHPDFRTNVTVHPNVDTRGLGSYAIWWPAEGYSVINANIPADVPDWIIAAMPETVDSPVRHIPDTPLAAYLAENASPEAAFAGILRKMASARPGERQSLTFWCANRTAEMIRDGKLLHYDAFAALADVARFTGLAPRQIDEVLRRIERTVLS